MIRQLELLSRDPDDLLPSIQSEPSSLTEARTVELTHHVEVAIRLVNPPGSVPAFGKSCTMRRPRAGACCLEAANY